jgi:hypothetical protein
VERLLKSGARLASTAAIASLLLVDVARAQIFTTAPSSLQRLAPSPAPAASPAKPPAVDTSSSRFAAPPPPASPVAAAPQPAPRSAPPRPAPVTRPADAAPPRITDVELQTRHATPRGVTQGNDAGEALRHLTNNIQGFRLTGEIGSSEWPIFVTTAQAQARLRFQLGYLAAVSVMPEASYLTLVINDVPVGRTNIIGTRGIRTVTFDIPAGLLKSGFNSVRISAEQRHRVDCSLGATYELWTQVDPTLTGLILPKGDVGVSNVAELPALPPDEEGALPIRAVLPKRSTQANVERVMRAVQTISLAGRFAQPIVDVGPMAEGEYGINLAIGVASELSEVLSGVAMGGVSGPRLMIVPAGQNRRATVIVTGRSDAEVGDALQQLSVAEELRGSKEGLRAAAAFPGFRIFGGQRVQLRDLGLASEEFSGRLYRAAFNLILPPDFYSADYGKVILDMAGGYAAGLSKGAQIVVSMNGRNVVSQKLSKSAGDVFKENPIPLPLGSLRPGLNRIEIEAQLPADGDTTCDPISAISGKKRFLFLDSTEIEIPRIARIARMPDLAVTATGGYPYIGGSLRPYLYLPAPSREAVGAAATMAAHLAIAAGKVIDFQLTVKDPGPDNGSTLVVAPAAALAESYLTSVGLDPRKLVDIWADKLNAPPGADVEQKLSKYEAMARHRLVLQRNFPAACHMPTPTGGYLGAEKSANRALDRNPVASIATEGQSRDLFGEWNTGLRGSEGVWGRIKLSIFQLATHVSSRFSGARNWIDQTIDGSYRKPAFTKQASLIVAQNILGSNSDSVRTLVIAPSAAQLAQGVDCLVDPRVWRQVGGQVAVLNASDAEVVEVPSDSPRLIPTQPLSIENSRLIIAGWFSLNTKIYVELALCLALLLAWTTRRFISSVGRRT